MPTIKNLPENPFYTTIDIPNEFFCDREKETDKIVKHIENGSNIVLKSPRRIGKSSLIMHVFKHDLIKKKYNTLFVDIYGTKNMDEFIKEFQTAFVKAPFAKTVRGKRQILELFQRIYLQANFSPDGNFQSARLGLSPFPGYSYTLSEMFDFLKKTSKPNLIVFDEFQKIKDYPEDAAAILRTYVQQMNNTHFIFSGSSRHMLHTMFENSDEPFYRSASSMDLDIISMPVYTEFCKKLFAMYSKAIDEEAVSLVYQLFSGNTYDMQEIMKETFMLMQKGDLATEIDVLDAIDNILDSRDVEFREKMDRIESQKARRLLFCIAKEGIATKLTSTEVMKKYGLDNASSVQNALIYLMDDSRNVVNRIGKSAYILQNRFFELWIARKNHFFDDKIEAASQRFESEKAFLTE